MHFRRSVLALSLMSSVLALSHLSAHAQKPGDPPPAWKQGMSAESESSALHPFNPIFTGTEAKDLQIAKLKVPAGFKVEVYADGVPEARSMTQTEKRNSNC